MEQLVMQVRECSGKGLKYLAIEPDGYAADRVYPIVVLLHGFGSHMGDLASLCPRIDSEGYVYICPNGPLAVDVGFGTLGYAWIPRGDEAGPQDVERAEEMLSVLLEEVAASYRTDGILLAGFSQGGMMAYSYGLVRPETFRGLVALSSRVRDPEGLTPRLPQDRTLPVFIAHGTDDSMIPVEDARRSRDFLEAQGYSPEYKEYPMGHEISEDVLADLVPWVHRVLSPTRAPAE